MLMSRTKQTEFLSALEDVSVRGHRQYILNSSVKLTGFARDKESTFTGSGVIVYSSDDTTTIVTAKHNLSVFDVKNKTPTLDDSLIKDFQNNIEIWWDNQMEFNRKPERKAAITGVRPVRQAQEDPWAYDVMILTSTDQRLALHASIWGVYSPNYNPIDLSFLQVQARYLNRIDQNKKEQRFIQTGYGFVREKAEDKKQTVMPLGTAGTNIAGCLQFRTCEPLADRKVPVYAQRSDRRDQYDTVIDAIQLTADPTSSTAPGDSGGPLFVVTGRQTTPRLFLVGTSYGADLSAAREPCPPEGTLRVNNISASLEYCYRTGLLSV